MKRITVLLAEDHMIVREGFRKMLELEDDLEVVGEAQDGRQAVALVQKLRPNVVLMDIAMPMLNGLKPPARSSKPSPAPKCSFFPRIAMTRMSKARPRPARWDFCSNKLPPTTYAGRFGKCKREKHFSVPPWPGAWTASRRNR